MSTHTCPWWLGYTFDNPLRRLVHDPAMMFSGLVEPGQTVADIGCGLGYFSLALARMVGPEGRVIAIDVQPEMLRRTSSRARRHGLDGSMEFRQCEPTRLGLDAPQDFVLAFWMVHEVPDPGAFFAEVRAALRPSGRLFIAEPMVHVRESRFNGMIEVARAAGLEVEPGPAVRFSRTVICSPGTGQIPPFHP